MTTLLANYFFLATRLCLSTSSGDGENPRPTVKVWIIVKQSARVAVVATRWMWRSSGGPGASEDKGHEAMTAALNTLAVLKRM